MYSDLADMPWERRRAKSPTSCGSSWQRTAREVERPAARLRLNAAPTASPSAKLWTASPRMTMRLELGMAQGEVAGGEVPRGRDW